MTEETEDWRQETRDWPRGASWPREHPSLAERLHELLILFPQRPRPLAPRLSRRPSATAYGLGPSVFTIRARKAATDRASVSQAVARRGYPAASANVARGLQALLPCRDPLAGPKDSGLLRSHKPVFTFLGVFFPRRLAPQRQSLLSCLHSPRSSVIEQRAQLDTPRAHC